MFGRSTRLALFSLYLIAILPPVTEAEECKQARIALLDMDPSSTASVLVPVSIEGTAKLMAVDTGAPLSTVDPQAANDLHLITHQTYEGLMYTARGEPFTQMAIVHVLDIGQMQARDARMLVWPSRLSSDTRFGGTLGVDLLRHYDVDIDFGARTLSLFSQDHCPGKVVYWGAPSVAVVPMHVINDGHIIIPVKLDGHAFDALFDTGASWTILSEESAHSVFGLDANSPDMDPVGNSAKPGAISVYRHTFKTLDLEGITIQNPTILVRDNLLKYSLAQAPHIGTRISGGDPTNGVPDLTLGLHELRNLHVYISYAEQKLYISSTGGTSAPAPQTGPSTDDGPKHPNLAVWPRFAGSAIIAS